MITGEDIEYLIWTYDLPETTGKKIRDIVVRQHETIGFSSYDELYQRISNLVERFTDNFGSKFWLRLDQGVTEDTRNTSQDIFRLEQTIEDSESEREPHRSVSIPEAIQLLSPNLNPTQVTVLKALSKRSENGQMTLSPEQLVANLDSISERLEELVRGYEKDGKLLIPRRPIVEIRWNPRVWVKYGRRQFNGNPLQFFRDNLDVYGGMGRKQLQRFDASLYRSLLETRQLADAIPERLTYSFLRTPEHGKIIEVYPVFSGSLKTASRAMGHDRATIRKYWRRKGFVTRPSGARDYDLYKSSRGGVDYGYLGEAMAERIKERGLIKGTSIVIGDIVIKTSDGLHYEDACDHFGILSSEELDSYARDKSYLLRNAEEQKLDRLSALYLAAIAPTIGLRSVASNLVAVVIGLGLEETDKVLDMAGIKRNPDFGYSVDEVRKRIFNPSFGFALKHLDLW